MIERTGEGPYLCTLDRTGRVRLDDASNVRVDLVVARVYDERLGDPRTEFVIEPVTGRAGPNRNRRLDPLARVHLTAGTRRLVEAMVQDLRRAAGVRGSVGVLLPGDNPANPGAYAAHTRYREGIEAFDGERWRSASRTWISHANTLIVRSGISTVAHILSVDVPDPGWPYYLLA